MEEIIFAETKLKLKIRLELGVQAILSHVSNVSSAYNLGAGTYRVTR